MKKKERSFDLSFWVSRVSWVSGFIGFTVSLEEKHPKYQKDGSSDISKEPSLRYIY